VLFGLRTSGPGTWMRPFAARASAPVNESGPVPGPEDSALLLFMKREVSSGLLPLLPGRMRGDGAASESGEWAREEVGRPEAVSVDIMGGAPCAGVRSRMREVRYWLCCEVEEARGLSLPFVLLGVFWGPGEGVCCGCSDAAVGGRELPALDARDCCPPLTTDARRDRRGEAEVLASTHSSSGLSSSSSSSPRLKCTWLTGLPFFWWWWRPAVVWPFRFVEDLLFLPRTSTLDLLRFRLVCDEFFLSSRLVAEGSRERLRSDVARRWLPPWDSGAVGGKAKAWSGEGDGCRLAFTTDAVEPWPL